jgi:hypothetical protein
MKNAIEASNMRSILCFWDGLSLHRSKSKPFFCPTFSFAHPPFQRMVLPFSW